MENEKTLTIFIEVGICRCHPIANARGSVLSNCITFSHKLISDRVQLSLIFARRDGSTIFLSTQPHSVVSPRSLTLPVPYCLCSALNRSPTSDTAAEHAVGVYLINSYATAAISPTVCPATRLTSALSGNTDTLFM